MKKIAAMVLAVCVLGGCSMAQAAPDAGGEPEKPGASASGRLPKDGQEKRVQEDTGVVATVEGNTVTIEKTPSGGRGGGKGPGNGGDRPEPPSGEMQRGGNPPSQDGVKTTVAVTLPDGCAILLEQEDGTAQEGSREDLAAGARIRIQYGEDGETAASVTVLAEKAAPPESSLPVEE